LKVDTGKIENIALPLRRMIAGIPIDYFTDTRYYPPVNTDKGLVTSYFLVLVAMDHRLSRPGRPYEAVIIDERFHGADLLYRLGMLKFNEDPGFYEPRRLSNISMEEVRDWLSPREFNVPTPVDIDVRTKLLRDIGYKVCKLYDCDPYNLILESHGFLKRTGEGFVERLKAFTAYQDPVEKKAFLLSKFLERRRVLDIVDLWNKEVPVDNHVTRLALRWGLVEVDNETLEKIASGIEFTYDEDVILRYTVRTAFKMLSQKAGVDPFILDDFLWNFGRRKCRREQPVCRFPGKTCELSKYCTAFLDPLHMVPEHHYYNTWFY